MADADVIIIGSDSAARSRRAASRRPAPKCSSSSAAASGARTRFRASRPIRGCSIRNDPAKLNGWFDLRMFPHMTVAHGRRRRRRVAGLRQHLGRSQARLVRRAAGPPRSRTTSSRRTTREVGRMMEIEAGAAERSGRSARSCSRTRREAAGWADRFRPLGIGGALRSRLVVRPAGPAQPREVEDRDEHPRRRAGHVRAPGRVRHRLPGQRAQHARLQLPRGRDESRARRSGRCTWCSDIQAVAGGYRVDVDRDSNGTLQPADVDARRASSSRPARLDRPSSC